MHLDIVFITAWTWGQPIKNNSRVNGRLDLFTRVNGRLDPFTL